MSKRKTPKSNLENKRIIFLEIGFIIALAAAFAAFEYKSYDQILYLDHYIGIHEAEEEIAPILLKKKQVIPKKPKSFFALNEVTDDTEIDTEIDIDIFDDAESELEKWEPVENEEAPIDEVIPSHAASIQPEFPGGERARLKFIGENFNIPRIDVENGISGTIWLSFVVNKEGYIENAVILRGISNASDAEALRVVNMMPRWKPGQQSIRKVAVQFNMSIKVRLM